MPRPVRSRPPRSGRQAAGRDEGVALPVVMGTTAVIMLFLLGALAATLANAVPARADQDAKAAVAAAQAGIDEYVSRLNLTGGGYWERGNTDPANPALSAAGMPVPGTSAQGARFRYRLLTTSAQTAQQGFILLEVTGTASAGTGAREVSRTLTARLTPRGFLDFLYFTDVEAIDPNLYIDLAYANRDGASGPSSSFNLSNPLSPVSNRDYVADPAKVREDCAKHHYAGRRDASYTASATHPVYAYDRGSPPTRVATYTSGRVSGYCREIQWTSGDVVAGPLHSNDALQINGVVRFGDPRVESAWAAGDDQRLWWGTGTPVGPTASPPGYLPRKAEELLMPAGNEALLQHVQPKVDQDPGTDRPGCLYRGATRIVFTGTTMKVLSPNTTNAPDRCLTTSARGSEQTKAIPPVIYVMPIAGSCTGVGYPRTGEVIGRTDTTDYAPCRGTAFVQGTVDGQVTVSAEDDIVVTADLKLEDRASTDIVGLVALNNVWVYHPVRADGSNLLTYASSTPLGSSDPSTVRTIEASILSIEHSFLVQNWRKGADLSSTGEASKLLVYGAIAQRFRGPVGTSGSGGRTGYLKNYVYDPRLAVLQPPYFLEPDNAPWEAVQISDG